MPDYTKGKIYKIVNDELADLVYIGSTVQPLKTRLCEHRKHSKKEYMNLSSKILFTVGKPKIILIQEYPCNNKTELEQRERYYIENIKCVNKNIPCRTKEEYYKDNKEHILQKSLLYYLKNHKEINEKRKEKIICECGRETAKNCLYRHKKSKIHNIMLLNKKKKELIEFLENLDLSELFTT